MSFSGDVKEELSRQISSARHCRIAEIAAIISMCGSISQTPAECFRLKIQTENIVVARKYFTLLKKTFNIGTEVFIRQNAYLKKSRTYTVLVKNHEDSLRIMKATKLLNQDLEAPCGYLRCPESMDMNKEAPCGYLRCPESMDTRTLEGMNKEIKEELLITDNLVIQNACCRRAFIRGAFLASGSISDPKKSYHFEIVCLSLHKAEQLRMMINSFHMDAKIILRKKYYVVYIKEGSQIVDILNVMEAHVALMQLENVRILKEMRNSVNRKVNCETANIQKTVSAAVKQIEDIQYIQSMIGLESLSESLEEIARIRLEYPEATLKELGMLLTPQVGKSGVNHRLRKLSTLAEELRQK